MRPLLLLDHAGLLRLVDADTGARIPFSNEERLDPPRQTVCVVWSQAGQWTAWSSTDGVPGGVHEIRLHDEHSDSVRTLAEFVDGFYLNPSPCGRYLAHLSSGPLGLELAITEIASGAHTIIERGQPLFWSWSPNSENIALHVGNRAAVADTASGDVRTLAHDVGAFTAPAWLPGGAVLIVESDRLAAFDPDGEPVTVVDDLGPARFLLSPDSRRLALLSADGVRVVDLATGLERVVSRMPRPVAMFWSPDGTQLAVVESLDAGLVRWLVDDGADQIELASFRPGLAWQGTVLPFFEQYAQSHNHWSADGTQLIAPSIDERGGAMALIHTVSSDDIEVVPGAALAWWADH